MATTPKKKTAGGGKSGSRSSSARSGARSGKGTGSRSSSRKAPAKRPIRREVTGVVFLILALCVFFSYFNQDGWLIVLLPTALKGLFGFGYFLMAPALAAASWILLTHKGRPVALRTASALLVPYLFGGVWHMLFCREDLSSPDGLLGKLWTTGGELYSGGVLSGGTAQGFLAVLGKPASVVIFCVLILVLLMVVFQISFSTLWQMWKERERLDYRVEDYEDEEDDEYFQPIAERKAEKPAPRPARPRAPRPEIDIPLDDDEETSREKKGGVLSSFFKPRDKEQMTPADVLAGSAPNGNAPAQPQEEPQPAPVPAPPPEPVPIQEPEFQEEPPVGTRRRKKDTAGEVEAATAQVAAEIANGMAVEKTYDFPPITLLDQNRQDNYIEAGAELRTNAQRLADTLHSFGVDATGGDVIRGPAITRYEFVLDQGVKLSKITNLADDIALALGASGVRIAPIPEKISVVGIEVPNKTVSPVLIRDVIESRAFTQHKSSVAFAVGRDIGNKDIVGDIAKLPHVLIAGTTGSGKSVCTNSLIISLLYKSSPEDVRFIMVDPKMVELAPYNGIPHLLIPVVTDPKKASGALNWAVVEMMDRYQKFAELNVRNIEGYNSKIDSIAKIEGGEYREKMPQIVIIVDELADLMMVAPGEVEDAICRLAQLARAAGIHLIIATQRPSVNVITGLIKANMPSRIAFSVSSGVDSRTIIDMNGAEKLLGKGDMLFYPSGYQKPARVQGAFVTDKEVQNVVDDLKTHNGDADYDAAIEDQVNTSSAAGTLGAPGNEEDDRDVYFSDAGRLIIEKEKASIGMLQRSFKIGFNRAARIMDQLCEAGVVGGEEGTKPRKILMTMEAFEAYLSEEH